MDPVRVRIEIHVLGGGHLRETSHRDDRKNRREEPLQHDVRPPIPRMSPWIVSGSLRAKADSSSSRPASSGGNLRAIHPGIPSAPKRQRGPGTSRGLACPKLLMCPEGPDLERGRVPGGRSPRASPT